MIQNHNDLLSTAEEIHALAQVLKTQEIIAVDTEFIRESTFFPRIALIQIATATESWLVDAQAFKGDQYSQGSHYYHSGLTPLLEIFTNRQILKVLHAAQGDQECL